VTGPLRSWLLAGLLVAVAALSGLASGSAQAQTHPRGPSKPHRPPVSQAPNGPPLSGEGVPAPSAGNESAAPPSGGDALVENGLRSPMCKEAPEELSSEAQRSCRLADFVAAPDPAGNYALDVNINTGYPHWTNELASIVQDLAGWVWTVFVSITRAMLVMFEWCYSLHLLGGDALMQVTQGLNGARVSFTEPWMAFALCVASGFVVYNGLVRRRVAETLGKTLAMLAMMAVGLWMIMDPGGTVVALDRLADEAGLGTLATVASGSPQAPRRTLTGDMRELFSATVEAPWCYLEFGDIAWCEGERDASLHQAALKIAEKEQSESGCPGLCEPGTGPKDRTLAISAALLREAKSNGEMFLALPANEAARNSTKEKWSLLSVLCGGGESADKCRGPTAAQAEFRSEKGTNQRLIGVFLIWMGGLGMLLLFGFLALQLLSAAIKTLVFLLIAPAAVLAPAFGDGGRSLFRTWMVRLMGAIVSKLVFSFLLGVMLMTTDVLLQIRVLKWAAQWLFVSGFWWGVFLKRHQVTDFMRGAAGGHVTPHRSLGSRVRDALETPRAMFKTARRIGGKLRPPAPDVQKRRRLSKAAHDEARKRADEQATRTLDLDHARAKGQVERAPAVQSRISAHREKLERLKSAKRRAAEEGDTRRAAKLGIREQQVESEIARDQKALTDARRNVADGEAAERLTGKPHTREQREQRSRFLDEQAALPAAGRRNAEGTARDYTALASLAGYNEGEYRRLSPGKQRKARLQVDRELATRSVLESAATDLAHSNEPAPSRKERRKASEDLDRVVSERVRDGGHKPLSEPKHRTALDRYLAESDAAKAGGSKGESAGSADRPLTREPHDGDASGRSGRGSTVMDDAHAVAQRRKRQLGRHPQ
jgi:hypothetical protein